MSSKPRTGQGARLALLLAVVVGLIAPQTAAAASPPDQTITFGPLSDRNYGDADFGLSASATSGLTVTFAGGGSCSVTVATVHITGVGLCTITASQAGDGTWNAAPDVPQSFTVNPGIQTISFGALPGRTVGDADFAISATATSTLAVSFSDGGSAACTVSGTTVHIVAVGTCTITASQAGDSNWNAATDVVRAFAVTADQTITFGALPGRTFGDADFAVSATATSGLTVAFSAGGGACSVSGTTVSIVAAGSCTITAEQAGDGTWNAAPAVPQSFTVVQAQLTVTASSSTMKFGSTPPAITPIYTGLKNGDTAPATLPGCSTPATSTSPVGTVWSTICFGAADPNYTMTYVAGSVGVIAGNSAPVCANRSGSTSMNAPGTGLLACANPDGNALHYKLVAGATHGVVTVTDAGAWTYTPDTDYLGPDAFTFRANDTLLDSNVATFTLKVEPDPTAHNDVAAIHQGSGPTAIAVLANDVDNDPGDHLIIQSVTQGANGVVTILPDGSGLTYDPNGAFLGTDSFSYTVIDVTQRTSTAFVQVKVIPVRPVTTTPVVTIAAPSVLGTSTVPVRVTWTLVDAGTGLKRYELQELRGGGTWTAVTLTSASARSASRNLTIGATYRYRVRATDTANHVGAWAIALVITPVLTQETAASIAYAGTWKAGAGSGLSGGGTRYSGISTASATFTFTGFGVGWVSQLGPRLGTAAVYVDGTLAKVVNLRSAVALTRRFVFSRSWTARGAHTLRIVVLGAPGGARIDADAFAVLR